MKENIYRIVLSDSQAFPSALEILNRNYWHHLYCVAVFLILFLFLFSIICKELIVPPSIIINNCYTSVSYNICIDYWVILTVRKHIKPKEALAGAGVAVGVEETLDDWVVVSALEVIEFRLHIVIVSPVAQRVHICQAAGGAQDASIGIIGIAGYGHPGGVDQVDDVTLEVQNVIIRRGACCGTANFRRQIQHIGPAALVVEEIQSILRTALCVGFPQQLTGSIGVIVPDAVYDFIGPQAVYVVVVADAVGPVACRCQLPPVPPCHGPGGQVAYVVEAGWIARTVIDVAAGEAGSIFRTADGCQKIPPIGVAIGIIDCVAAVILVTDIAIGVVLIIPGAVEGADCLRELALVIIGVSQRFCCAAVGIELFLCADIAQGIIGIPPWSAREALKLSRYKV